MRGIGWLWVLIGYNTEWFIPVHLPRLQYARKNFFVFWFLGYAARIFHCVIMEIASLHLKIIIIIMK